MRRLDSETKDEAVKLLKLGANKKLLQNHFTCRVSFNVSLRAVVRLRLNKYTGYRGILLLTFPVLQFTCSSLSYIKSIKLLGNNTYGYILTQSSAQSDYGRLLGTQNSILPVA